MKKLLILPCFIFLFSCENKKKEKTNIQNSSSDSFQAVSKNDSVNGNRIPENIEEIKTEYALISNQLNSKKLDSTSFNYECEERSGSVVFYTSDGKLKSIKHSFSEYSHFSSVEQYYLKNDSLFFILKQDTSWSFEGGTPEKPETKDNIEEQRIYVVNGKAVDCHEKKYTIKSASANNPVPEKIQNVKSEKCSFPELQKTFALLIKNKEKNGKINCIQ